MVFLSLMVFHSALLASDLPREAEEDKPVEAPSLRKVQSLKELPLSLEARDDLPRALEERGSRHLLALKTPSLPLLHLSSIESLPGSVQGKMSKKKALLDLNDDLLILILELARKNHENLMRLRLVCKRFNEVIQFNTVAINLSHRNLRDPLDEPYDIPKEAFRSSIPLPIAHLRMFKNLHTLKLKRNRLGALGPTGAILVGGLKGLRVLDIGRNSLGDGGVEPISGLINLEELYIGNNSISNKGARHLSKLNKLRLLSIDNNYLIDATFLSGLRDLVALDIGYNDLRAEGAQDVSKVASLQELYINGNAIGDEGTRYLTQLKKLHKLDVSFNFIRDLGMRHLSSLEELRVLYIHYNYISDIGVESINRLKLDELEISDNNLSPRGIEALKDLRKARAIKITRRKTLPLEGVEVYE
jgi:Leucine-rich repeat (LRR) protein